MVKLEGVELGGLYRRRPETGQEVHKLGKPLEVWLLNDNDSMDQVRAIGKGTFLLQICSGDHLCCFQRQRRFIYI